MSKVTHACNLRSSQVKERGLRVQGQSELGNREERWEESRRNENYKKNTCLHICTNYSHNNFAVRDKITYSEPNVSDHTLC